MKPTPLMLDHGSTPTTCVHGQDQSDALECEYRCAATMPGHWCTRREHADDRHVWAMSDEEAKRLLRAGQELGFIAEPDPLDESDHRARHFLDGGHLWWRECCGRWHLQRRDGNCGCDSLGPHAPSLEWWAEREPLTFCDCPDATEAENGATD